MSRGRHHVSGLSVRPSVRDQDRTISYTKRLWEFRQIYNLGALDNKMTWLAFEFKRSKVKVTAIDGVNSPANTI